MYKLDPNDTANMRYILPDHNITIEFKPTHFTQVNFSINRLLISRAIHLLDINKKDILIDLFCGIGNFTLPISKYCKKVIGIELADEMIEQASHNAAINSIENVTFKAADLFKVNDLDFLEDKPNKIVLDPPRSGAKEIIPTILSLKPSDILYVSCNPVTLAQDTAIICQDNKYYLETCGIVDMFPQTNHIETIALFKRSKND